MITFWGVLNIVVIGLEFFIGYRAWWIDKRMDQLWEKNPVLYGWLPSWMHMLSRFWIWDLDQFLAVRFLKGEKYEDGPHYYRFHHSLDRM